MDIDYAIIRRAKRKTLSIVIRPNNDIEVLAPSRMPTALIHELVHNKHDWIQKKLTFNNNVRAPYQAKLFIEGELFDLLGKTYPLSLIGRPSDTHISDGKLITTSESADKIKTRLTRWYRKMAKEHIQQRCSHFSPTVGRTPTLVGIKNYKSRWGSCHHDGRVYFNWRLMMAPAWVLDYVIVHELCHLIQPNHSKAFWHEVARTMPDYQQAQTWLKTNALLLEF